MDRRFWIIFCLIGLTLGDNGIPPGSQRPTRTIARFFGFDSGSSSQQTQQQQQQQQPQQSVVPQGQVFPQAHGSHYRKPVVPLIYSVKYYDRTSTGENGVATGDKVDVQEHPYINTNEKVQPTPARVFLNVYSGAGQPSPVYYDNKGQLLVPCPVYDHLYVADPSSVPVVRAQQVPAQQQVVPVPVPQAAVTQQQVQQGKPKQQQQQPVQQVLPVPQVVSPVGYPQPGPVGQPFQEFIYYSTPTNVPGKDGVRFAVVGYPTPYDYPYVYSGGYPSNTGFYPGAYNPYLYVKPQGPSVPGHHHHVGIVSVVPPPVPQNSVSQSAPVGQGNSVVPTPAVEKKDGEKVAEN